MQRNNMLALTVRTLAILAVTFISVLSAGAQSNFKNLHVFSGTGSDGSSPVAGLILDHAGNLYGTTQAGGTYGFGTVFTLSPTLTGGWKYKVLYAFTGSSDGAYPGAGLIFDSAGSLYGTTEGGGNAGCAYASGCGVVFKLTPNVDGSWTQTVLFAFTPDGTVGAFPFDGVVFNSGNLYGTTFAGGTGACTTQDVPGCGVVFQLAPNGDGSWTESVLYSLNSSNGLWPVAGLIFDAAGNLYGTAPYGADTGLGAIFELAPNSDGSWTESLPHIFHATGGGRPVAGLIIDAKGNLYGTAREFGQFGYGVVFRLRPTSSGWRYSPLWHFQGSSGGFPTAGLARDAAGNLYGTTSSGGAYGYGVVFKLSPISGVWKYTVLRAFQDKPAANPNAGLVRDSAGNLYGTTTGDGITTFGTVYQITP